MDHKSLAFSTNDDFVPVFSIVVFLYVPPEGKRIAVSGQVRFANVVRCSDDSALEQGEITLCGVCRCSIWPNLLADSISDDLKLAREVLAAIM